ncbi:glycosyltransferase involved in cell wall biosynthesis [Ancylobacter sp. 3268]|uniref:glycosyltransferase family 2 protein n=1 Tax=Ancylobacter sp. 3268 TaxID=2817752 RepID=UPI002863D293|nr:glycosyltransferase family A protein [Ancylobacter sp. 3268]MDR6951046.1 glycosyltransferase involved in cell wall biosynthesis [Ancylobacter sp. 3268]
MPTTFAVVITNYNYGRFVLEAVDSALAQSRAPNRVIVIDDGSSDDSALRLTQTYGDDPRVELVFSPNRGQLAGFAAGVARADADVVCFLDADDLWKPDYLARLGALYDARPDIDFVFSNLHQFEQAHGIEAFADAEEDLGHTAVMTYLTGAWYGASTSALSLRLYWARRCTDFPEPFIRMWRLCADGCVVLSASIYGARKYYLPTNSVRYRVHGGNGWYANRTDVSDYRESIAKRGTVNYCAGLIGLAADSAAMLPLELATKPAPPDREIARYRDVIERLARDPAAVPPLDHLPLPRREPARSLAKAAAPLPPPARAAGHPALAPPPDVVPAAEPSVAGIVPRRKIESAFIAIGQRSPWRHPRRYLRDILRVVLQKPNV